jgi:DHA1 family solute carrier family 18 vesicular amine transporter 1/2
LYEAGGIALPFQFVSALALVAAGGFALLQPPIRDRGADPAPVSILTVARVPAVALCAAIVVVTSATIAMLEPVLPLFFDRRLGLTPARVGLLFGAAAVASIVMPLVYGPMIHRLGARQLTLTGLVLAALWMPVMAIASSFPTALAIIVVQWMTIALILTPSLAYMAEVTAFAGGDAYGIGYGIYNTAWGMGVLSGPALGGWLFDRIGFATLMTSWAIVVSVATIAIWVGTKERGLGTRG